TAGHKQHLAYARLRAIESRRWVVRSANTGISAVINPMGTITQKLGWEKEGLLTASVPTYNRMTFYARYGDLISKAALLLTFILVGYSTLLFFRRKR
ncbi:MAG TPA: nitrilase-related carbon-nitrogen hydrolase, partial [Flavihumibacter sp.]|nr:nitrilase-related carbon-nitrogen hydrolase [Flavihumibacter sp.]